MTSRDKPPATSVAGRGEDPELLRGSSYNALLGFWFQDAAPEHPVARAIVAGMRFLDRKIARASAALARFFGIP